MSSRIQDDLNEYQMELDKNNPRLDFIRRTLHNIEVIEKRACEDGEGAAYEVTQLVNSLLGLVILPKEAYWSKFPKLSRHQMSAQGWPEGTVAEWKDDRARNKSVKENPHTLYTFMYHIRNATAHFGLDFSADKKKQIQAVILQDRTFKTTLTVQDPTKLVKRIAEHLEETL